MANQVYNNTYPRWPTKFTIIGAYVSSVANQVYNNTYPRGQPSLQ